MEYLASSLAQLVNSTLNKETPDYDIEEASIPSIIETSYYNQMGNLVFPSLIRATKGEETKRKISDYVKGSILKSAVQVQYASLISKALEENKIKHLVMKGAVLRKYYPSFEMREMSDIDIWVSPEDLDRADEILIERGLELLEKIHHHHILGMKPFLIVELHWAMYDEEVDEKQFRYFNDTSRHKLVNGTEYTYELSPEDFYVYMISHMAKHFYQMGCGVRHLVDINIYRKVFEDKLNEEYLKKELSYLSLYKFENHMRKLASIWLDGEESNDFYDNLLDYMLGSGIYGKDENGIWNEFCNQAERTSRLRLALWYAFPPYEYMVKYYPELKENRGLLFLKWIERGFNGMINKTGKKKTDMIQQIDGQEIKKLQRIYKEVDLKFSK